MRWPETRRRPDRGRAHVHRRARRPAKPRSRRAPTPPAASKVGRPSLPVSGWALACSPRRPRPVRILGPDISPGEATMRAYERARGLGWFSIGLGLCEVFAGRKLARALGLEDRATLIRLYGLREIATGIAIFASGERALWLWARVAGDALDLVTLAAALNRTNPKRRNAVIAAGNVAAVTAFDVLTARHLPV